MSLIVIGNLLRTTMTAALPSGFSQIVYDALDIVALPTSERAVSITYELGEFRQVSFGKKRVQSEGIAHIRLYEPSDKGDGGQLTIADRIAGLLTNSSKSESGVDLQYRVAGLSNVLRTGAHWERVVRVPFRVTYYLN